jgi:2-keto-4-pentenoate hydratase/2-oxohepta-3-ene-1,7-dioic acid hydratase in catechol pathway
MKIFCVGRNYSAHAREMGNEVPEEPVIFMKPKTALCPAEKPWYYPEFTNELHYECELVLRVSKNGRYINERYAWQFYDKVTVGIDFTARDIQTMLKQKGLPWEKSKGFDNSAVIGKWVNLHENMNENDIKFGLIKNGETVQKGNSGDMIFSFNKIVADISNYFTLNIGDIIYTGTPEGAGECVVGDHLEAYLGDDIIFGMDIR